MSEGQRTALARAPTEPRRARSRRDHRTFRSPPAIDSFPNLGARHWSDHMWTTAKIPRDWQRTSLVRTVMHVRTESALETRLAEALMSALYPCDLGDGIEVLHDVEEQIEIEMDCDLGDDAWDSAP